MSFAWRKGNEAEVNTGHAVPQYLFIIEIWFLTVVVQTRNYSNDAIDEDFLRERGKKRRNAGESKHCSIREAGLVKKVKHEAAQHPHAVIVRVGDLRIPGGDECYSAEPKIHHKGVFCVSVVLVRRAPSAVTLWRTCFSVVATIERVRECVVVDVTEDVHHDLGSHVDTRGVRRWLYSGPALEAWKDEQP